MKRTTVTYEVDLRNRKTGNSEITLFKTEYLEDAWNFTNNINKTIVENYNPALPPIHYIDNNEGYVADVFEKENDINIPQINRLELLCKALNGHNYTENEFFDFYMGENQEFIGTFRQDKEGNVSLYKGIEYLDKNGSVIATIEE